MNAQWTGIRFGLGLVEIGRPWGFRSSGVPDERGAVEFLLEAYRFGVRLFDTAPSYALSEQRVSLFLRELTAEQRASLTIATKFGETWDFEAAAPVTAHTYDALMQSLENSFRLLGRIDVLQVHKSTPEVLRSDALQRALEAAHVMGVQITGASVKDLESADIACESPLYSQLQLPFNQPHQEMLPAIERAKATGRLVFTNRPFGEGRLLHEGSTPADCVRFVSSHRFDGAILFGTSNTAHLRENLEVFSSLAYGESASIPSEPRE